MVKDIIQRGLIGSAMTLLKEKAAPYPGEGFSDRLEACHTELNYMSDFMLSGYEDPHRAQVYAEIKKKLLDIDYDLSVRSGLMEQPYIKVWHKQLFTHDTTPEGLQTLLLATADDATRHHEALNISFMALISSYHWTAALRNEWTLFLSSERTDATDRQTLVSALTISAIENFDYEKVLCLAEVYRDSKTEQVRQRALVGCLLALSRVSGDEMREVRSPILDTLLPSDGAVTEIFMQMLACANVDRDTREITGKLMPNILRNQPFEIKDGKIVERNEDNTDDENDDKIELMENSVKKILSMQKNGADIFFSGFKQMKRLPFFNKHVNWLIPFYKEHPDLSEECKKALETKFIDRVIKQGPFCESDKYSFLLGMAKAMDSVPDNIREMMENGEAGPIGMHKDDEDMQNPSFLRLQYLQDLYRFYRLCPLALKLYNPFSELHKCHLGIATATHISDNEKRDLCLLLLKKDKEMQIRNTVARLLNRFNDRETYERHFCHAQLKMTTGDFAVAINLFNKCMELHPGSQACMRGLAKAYYQTADYEKAAFYYDALHTLKPESLSYLLNYCMAMTQTGKANEVTNELFRLDFEHPDTTTVLNTLTWSLLHAEKTEQALSAAKRMMKTEGAARNYSACINAAYAYIANKDIPEGIQALKNYAETLSSEERTQLPETLAETMAEDTKLLSLYGIEEAERAIIINRVTES